MKEMAKEQMKCAFFGKTDKTRKGSTKGVPFVVTFNPKLTLLAKKNIELSKYLGIGLEVKNAFTTTPMVSFRSARKIRDYLLSAIRCPLERNVGSTKYSKSSWEVCNNIESTLFFSGVTGKTYKINHGITVIVNV